MIQQIGKTAWRLLVLGVAGLVLVACSGGGGEFFDSSGKPVLADEGYVRLDNEIPLATWGNNPVRATHGEREGFIDVSTASKGYVTAAVTSATDAVFMLEKVGGDQPIEPFQYKLDNDGTHNYFPLAYGDGTYKFTIYLHQEGNTYEIFQEERVNAVLESEFAPFLVPNRVVNYNANTEAVKLGRELTEHCSDDMEIVRMVYYWISENIVYDLAKAENIDAYGRYVPDVDAILNSRTGICYDYASLAATMLRSNGVPTKLVMGNVRETAGEPETVYHAWNEVYTDGGWVAVKFEVKPGWDRVDITFAASQNEIASFVGDGTNYYETSYH